MQVPICIPNQALLIFSDYQIW